ncbi:hypothetical protein MPL3356_340094 [Mesorhizobium plurifarium]|uniref:Uncharacterized protein n=1 Tax=Mesorhizobium plurifarium TaxID=69974 RepID=A0A090DV72_MESPL|nr:hypothetical protein MPL3356_340094 [Mesorhizobium plurifarium]
MHFNSSCLPPLNKLCMWSAWSTAISLRLKSKCYCSGVKVGMECSYVFWGLLSTHCEDFCQKVVSLGDLVSRLLRLRRNWRARARLRWRSAIVPVNGKAG